MKAMMSTRGENRIWAKRDHAIVPPQRGHARSMRANPTDAEQELWLHLRKRLAASGTHFRRQVQIGPYIADFVSHKAKLVIEVDGGSTLSVPLMIPSAPRGLGRMATA